VTETDAKPAPAAGAGAPSAPAPLDRSGITLHLAPHLGVLAAVAATFDLAINRIGVRAMAELAEPLTVLEWMRFGALPRNLTAIAGIFALLAALFSYLRMPGFAPLWVRLPVAMFAGILTPTLTLATFLPRERMAAVLVLFGMFAANALVVLFATAAFSYRNRWLRAGLGLALAYAVQALIVVVIASVRALVQGGFGGPIAYVARHGGELAWLLVPIAIAPALRPSTWTARDRIAASVGLAVLAIAIALGIGGEMELHPHYSTVMYGAFRIAALPEEASIVYVAPAAIAFAGGAFGLAGSDPWRRQLGAGLLLWIAGGYAARSPVQLLDTALAIVLFARAAQSADPSGIARARSSWMRAPEPDAEREERAPVAAASESATEPVGSSEQRADETET
jgi:hypothetical protein